ncbi:MAG: sensor domain-containing diguanylate cyclase [Tolumonas sp.]|nr:sensor domain-containing diguanylate cyclase [Tolumonas sp.]
MKEGDFSISFPNETTSSAFIDFESELLQLAAWLEVRFTEFSKLQEISAEICQGSLLDDVLERIYSTFKQVIPFDRIGCALISNDQQIVKAHWAKTDQPEKIKLAHGYTSPLSGSSLESILHSQQPRILNDLSEYLVTHPNSKSTRLIVAEGIQSSLTCPLIIDAQPVGFLFFSSKQKNTYLDVHQRIFIHIARQVSVLIEKSRLYQHIYELNKQLLDAMQLLKEQSCRDALTQIFHRGAIMEFMQQSLKSGIRKKQPVSVIMADLDHFKTINDTFGHGMGDTVLKSVSHTITAQLRNCDSVGRYGGEEFLIVLGDTDAASALLVAERIRHAIAALQFEHPSGNLTVTISMGISCSDNKNESKDDNTLLLQADTALYHAKHSGRNRVSIS